MDRKRALQKLHLWLGLLAGAILVMQGFTGALIAFEQELDEYFNPSLWRVQPAQHALPLDRVVRELRVQHPDRAFRIDFPRGRDRAVRVEVRGVATHFLCPYTHQDLGVRDEARPSLWMRFWGTVWYLHEGHWLNGFGNVLSGYAGIALMLLALSGLVLWWPGRLGRVAPSCCIDCRGPFKRRNYSFHRAAGFYLCIPFLLMGWSVTFWVFADDLRPIVRALTRSPDLVPKPEVTPPLRGELATLASLDQILDTTRERIPTATLRRVDFPGQDELTKPVEVRAKRTRDPVPNGRDYLYFDPWTATLLRHDDPFLASPADRVIMVNRALHTGDILRLPGRLWWFLAALMLPLMFASGLLIWFGRRHWRNGEPSEPGHEHPAEPSSPAT